GRRRAHVSGAALARRRPPRPPGRRHPRADGDRPPDARPAAVQIRAGCRGGVPRVHRAPRDAAALRARPQRPQLDRPRAPAAGEPTLRRGGRHPQPGRPADHHARRTPQGERVRRGSRSRGRRSDPGRTLITRSITLGIVGDSAAGKTTLTRGLVRVLGEDNVTHVCVDDYHRYDRKQRAERNITPLHPDCNHMDVMAQHLAHLRAGEPILKPVYRHEDGTFGPLVRVDPKQFAVVDGLLGYYTEELRRLYDVRLFLAPPEELRRQWKVQRDCSRRGYTTDQVLA